jgi:Zn-dependent protease
MKKPTFLSEADQTQEITHFLGVPLVVRQNLSALPLAQFGTMAFFYRQLDRKFPELSKRERILWSLSCTLALLGSEWCHNLAHTLISKAIKKPVDAILINFGMPLLIYFKPDDPQVTPRQHIIRAIGGPAFNLAVMPALYVMLKHTKANTPDQFLAQLAFDTNVFIFTASLTPFPSLDGGPIMKWSLVQHGKSISEAEQIVGKANGVSAVLLSILGLLSYLRGRKLLAILLGVLGIGSLAIALGWIEEAY